MDSVALQLQRGYVMARRCQIQALLQRL